MTFKPTEQQIEAIAKAQKFNSLNIEACAGAAKTTTLKLISEAIPERSLYMAFNSVTAKEAQEKFPAHVVCRTTHSLAYASFGRTLQHKLQRPRGRYVNVAGTGSEIARYYKLQNIEDALTSAAVGLLVKQTLQRFESSADGYLMRKHVPVGELKKRPDLKDVIVETVYQAAKQLWQDRKNPSSDVLATHDTYLKLFQLSKPDLGFPVVYLDEGQDTTPCVLDIFETQECKSIMVGDRRQSIYQWRGAINAMEHRNVEKAYLSRSFRYGQAIAEIAEAVLQKDMEIKGREDIECKIGYGVIDKTKPYMYLFRTNAALLAEAVVAIDKGEKIKIEVDVTDFIKQLQSAEALYKGDIKNVKHESLVPYPTWYELLEEAKADGGDLQKLVNIISGGMGQHFIDVLSNYEVSDDAIATFTTAHKSKGRECEQVMLAGDFKTHIKGGAWVGLNEFEENLLYVAVTRAMSVLEINRSVEEVLIKYGIKYTINFERDNTEENNG